MNDVTLLFIITIAFTALTFYGMGRSHSDHMASRMLGLIYEAVGEKMFPNDSIPVQVFRVHRIIHEKLDRIPDESP